MILDPCLSTESFSLALPNFGRQILCRVDTTLLVIGAYLNAETVVRTRHRHCKVPQRSLGRGLKKMSRNQQLKNPVPQSFRSLDFTLSVTGKV